MVFQSVLSMAPLRISFLGGGSDIPSFYEATPGAVISAAINKYVYVHIKRHDSLFQEKYRISYSEVEHAQERSSIKNDIVRSCLELLGIDEPLQISTSADLPANSGLGSSSSFAVALLLGLHAMNGEELSPVQLAEEACAVEMKILNLPIGKQDQYAAAFGGLNFFGFDSTGTVTIQPLNISTQNLNNFFNSSILIWTGQSRKAESVLRDQNSRKMQNHLQLTELTNLARDLRDELMKPILDFERIGGLITEGWELKQTFSTKIATPEVHSITKSLKLFGCHGFKLLGAGGGGFVLAISQKDIIDKFAGESKWRFLKPVLDHQGARIVSLI